MLGTLPFLLTDYGDVWEIKNEIFPYTFQSPSDHLQMEIKSNFFYYIFCTIHVFSFSRHFVKTWIKFIFPSSCTSSFQY